MYEIGASWPNVHKSLIIRARKYHGPRSWGQDLVGSRGGTMPGPIALKLRDLRAKRELTQEQAAELARVTTRTLMDLESGKRPPYMPTLTQTARAHGPPPAGGGA